MRARTWCARRSGWCSGSESGRRKGSHLACGHDDLPGLLGKNPSPRNSYLVVLTCSCSLFDQNKEESKLKFVRCLCVIALVCATVCAQEKAPKFEVFGGVSFLHHFNQPGVGRDHGWGWNTSGTRNWNDRWGVAVDFSGSYSRRDNFFLGGPSEEKARIHTFMVGPTFKWRNRSRIEPFGRVLIGAIHERVTIEFPGCTVCINVDSSEAAFGFGAGGGADLRANRNVAFRGQFDWVRANEGMLSGRNHLRTSLGIVFRFGKP